jgi:hypothetical protein
MNGMAVHNTLRPIAIANAAPYNGQTPRLRGGRLGLHLLSQV